MFVVYCLAFLYLVITLTQFFTINYIRHINNVIYMRKQQKKKKGTKYKKMRAHRRAYNREHRNYEKEYEMMYERWCTIMDASPSTAYNILLSMIGLL